MIQQIATRSRLACQSASVYLWLPVSQPSADCRSPSEKLSCVRRRAIDSTHEFPARTRTVTQGSTCNAYVNAWESPRSTGGGAGTSKCAAVNARVRAERPHSATSRSTQHHIHRPVYAARPGLGRVPRRRRSSVGRACARRYVPRHPQQPGAPPRGHRPTM